MSGVTYGIGGGLSDDQLRRLHETALRLLDEVGVEIGSERILRRIAGQSGVRISGTRVRFAPDRVNGFLEEHRASLPPAAPPRDEFFLEVLGGYCFQVVDLDTDRLRPTTTADCVRMAGVVDGLYDAGVRGGNPGMPQDVPVPLREILSCKISMENCRAPGWPPFTGDASGEAVMRMCEAAGQPVGVSVFVLDPLVVEGPTVDMAVDFLERKAKVSLALSNMPLVGATTPIFMPAAFVESIATMLGAFTAFKMLGADLGISPLIFPFDMRYGGLAFGTPEHIVSWLMAGQIGGYYNRGQGTWFCQAFHTNAILPGAHSMLTRSSFATIGALHGARHFGFAGWLGLDKIFSLEQLVLDLEIVRYVQHLVRAVEFTDETLGFDILRDAGPRAEFLTHPSTLAHCREQWTSPLFRNQTLEQWESQRPPDMKDQIREILRKAEADHRFRLAPDAAREVEKIYRAAVARVG